MKLNDYLDFHPDIENALKNNLPIVALESTIISHGMPYPKNIETALMVEETVRSNNAVPATIAIIKGRLKICLLYTSPSPRDVEESRMPSSA